MSSCSAATGTTVAAVVINATGHATYRAAVDSVFNMPWGGLSGRLAVVSPPTTLSDLCSLSGSSWDGKVVLGDEFYGPGCSYEYRALVAAKRQAAGVSCLQRGFYIIFYAQRHISCTSC